MESADLAPGTRHPLPRRTFVTLVAGGLFAAPLAVEAQQPGRVYRLGVLSPIFVRPPTGGPDSQRDTFLELTLQDLRDRGYIERKSLMVEHRSAEGHVQRLPELAAELVRLHVDVILAEAAPAIHAALTATTTIPIVMITGDDPVRSGFVASLGRPGGNITGVTILARDLAVKRLEFLKMAVPEATRIAVLGNFASQTSAEQLGEVKRRPERFVCNSWSWKLAEPASSMALSRRSRRSGRRRFSFSRTPSSTSNCVGVARSRTRGGSRSRPSVRSVPSPGSGTLPARREHCAGTLRSFDGPSVASRMLRPLAPYTERT
jgi:hypothetical protein